MVGVVERDVLREECHPGRMKLDTRRLTSQSRTTTPPVCKLRSRFSPSPCVSMNLTVITPKAAKLEDSICDHMFSRGRRCVPRAHTVPLTDYIMHI